MESAASLPAASVASPAPRRTTVITSLAAVGIVYGDLGTSPLYTYQTIVSSVGGHASATVAMGLLSLVVWALIITVSLKYCLFVMRADNHGEGGILALMSLVTSRSARSRWSAGTLVVMGLFGAALLYGDGIITPAISVLSALECINVLTDAFKPYAVPAALVVLLALFGAQARGTASIGRIFWADHVALVRDHCRPRTSGRRQTSRVIFAIDPRYAIGFLAQHGMHSFVVAWWRVSWRSPAPRRSMPIWATSGAIRYAPPGILSCCPPCCSATPDRPPC